jgi:hypothetical protein
MTLSERLDAINEIIFRAENAAMACDTLQPTIKMMRDSDITKIYELTLYGAAAGEESATPCDAGVGK